MVEFLSVAAIKLLRGYLVMRSTVEFYFINSATGSPLSLHTPAGR
jgi:hypothetical protein